MTLGHFMLPAIWKEVSKDRRSEVLISKVNTDVMWLTRTYLGRPDDNPQNPQGPDLGYHTEVKAQSFVRNLRQGLGI